MPINDAISQAQGAMANVSQRLNGIGDNVANLNTTGFRKQRFINVLQSMPGDDASHSAGVILEEQHVFELSGERVSTGMQTDFASTGSTLLVTRLNDNFYATRSGSAALLDDRLVLGGEFILQVVVDGTLQDWIVDVNETLAPTLSSELTATGVLSDNGLSVGNTVRAQSVVLIGEEGALRVTPTFVLAANREWQWFLADDQGNRLTSLLNFDVDALDRPGEGSVGEVTLLNASMFAPVTLTEQQFRWGEAITSGDGFFMLQGEEGLLTVSSVVLGINDDDQLIDTVTGYPVLFQSAGTDYAPLDDIDALRSATDPTATLTVTGTLASIDAIGSPLADPLTVEVIAADNTVRSALINIRRSSSTEYSVTVEIDGAALTVLGTLVTNATGAITSASRTVRAVGQGFDLSIIFGSTAAPVNFGETQTATVDADGELATDPDLLILSASGELSSIIDGEEQTVGTFQLAAAAIDTHLTLDFDWSDIQVSSSVLTSSVIAATDGRAQAQFSSIQIDRDGMASILFSDGTERAGGRIALVSDHQVNRESLDGVWFAVNTSTDEIIRTTGEHYAQGERVLQGVLERSNVDLTGEFSELILAQRAYQALSQVINVGDKMLETLLRDS